MNAELSQQLQAAQAELEPQFKNLRATMAALSTAVAHCHLPRFEHLYRNATLSAPPSHLRDALRLLM
jgi:hypothetical protein